MTFALASTRQRAPVQLIQTLEIYFGNKSTFSIERRPNAFVESCQNEVRPICTGCIIIGNQMDFAVGMAAGIRSHPLRGMDDFFQPREINAARDRFLQRPTQRLDVRLQCGDTILPLVKRKRSFESLRSIPQTFRFLAGWKNCGSILRPRCPFHPLTKTQR